MIFNNDDLVTKIVGVLNSADEDAKDKTYTDAGTDVDGKVSTVIDKAFRDGVVYYIDGVTANNVANKEVTLKFVDKDGNAIKGEKVTFETGSSNIELSADEDYTDRLGKVDFKIAGVRDGSYKVYVKCGSYEATIVVTVGATGAAYVNVVKEPTAPIDVDAMNLSDFVRFTFTDINGNAVTNAKAATNGATNAFYVNATDKNEAKNYVAVISQPAGSKLEDKDLKLVARDTAKGTHEYEATIVSAKELSVEGTYEFKVVLDNGNYKTVKVEVKEFQTPVSVSKSATA